VRTLPTPGLHAKQMSIAAALLATLSLGATGSIRAESLVDRRPPSPAPFRPLKAVDYGDYPHLLGGTGAMQAQGLTARNGIAYTVTSTGVKIWDCANPLAPVQVGVLQSGNAILKVCLSGDLAYVADTSGYLYIYDLAASATQPPLLGYRRVISSQPTDLVVAGRWVYLLGVQVGIYAVDCLNPRQPVVQPVDTWYWGANHAMAAVGNVLATCTGGGDVLLFTLSNPARPTYVSQVTTPGTALKVAIRDDMLFVGDQQGGLRIYDAHDPAAPFEVSHVEREGFYAAQLILDGDRLYVGNGWDGCVVIDIADLSQPRLLTSFGVGPASSMARLGDLVLMGTTNGTVAFDVSNPRSVPRRSARLAGREPRDIFVQGLSAWVADWGGIYEYDLSGTGAPALVDSIPLPGDVIWSIAVRGDHVFATYGSVGLFSCRLHDHDSAGPAHILAGRNWGTFHEIALAGDVAVVAASNAVVFVDISRPEALTVLGGINLGSSIYDIDVNGNLVYVAAGYSGVSVVDFTDPAHPALAWNVDTVERTHGIAWREPYLYAGTTKGLNVYDGADPRRPTLLRQLPLAVDFGSPEFGDGVAYVPTTTQGLQVLSLTDPKNPGSLGGFDPLAFEAHAVVQNQQVYLAAGDSLYVLPLQVAAPGTAMSAPARDEARPAGVVGIAPALDIVPNPANPRARVWLTLAEPATAVVDVFDLAGRRIRRLAAGPLPSGRTGLDWNGADEDGRPVASGLYLVRAVLGDRTLTARVQLVR
jgi:hypothetical protein